jgi:spermine synthase
LIDLIVRILQGNGISSTEALAMFEDELSKMEQKVEFTKTYEFVPSFMEKWVFYQMKAKRAIINAV